MLLLVLDTFISSFPYKKDAPDATVAEGEPPTDDRRGSSVCEMIMLRFFGVYAAVGVGYFHFIFPLPYLAIFLAFVCVTRCSTSTRFETVLGLGLLRDFVR
jgi:hypothetical protein